MTAGTTYVAANEPTVSLLVRVNCENTSGQQTSRRRARGTFQGSLASTGAQGSLVCPQLYSQNQEAAPPSSLSTKTGWVENKGYFLFIHSFIFFSIHDEVIIIMLIMNFDVLSGGPYMCLAFQVKSPLWLLCFHMQRRNFTIGTHMFILKWFQELLRGTQDSVGLRGKLF